MHVATRCCSHPTFAARCWMYRGTSNFHTLLLHSGKQSQFHLCNLQILKTTERSAKERTKATAHACKTHTRLSTLAALMLSQRRLFLMLLIWITCPTIGVTQSVKACCITGSHIRCCAQTRHNKRLLATASLEVCQKFALQLWQIFLNSLIFSPNHFKLIQKVPLKLWSSAKTQQNEQKVLISGFHFQMMRWLPTKVKRKEFLRLRYWKTDQFTEEGRPKRCRYACSSLMSIHLHTLTTQHNNQEGWWDYTRTFPDKHIAQTFLIITDWDYTGN